VRARFVQRLTFILRDGSIEKVFYPAFPPDHNAAELSRGLAESSRASG
jgi:peroxiredoxin